MQRVQELDALRSLGRRVEHRLRLVLEQLQPGGDVARVSAPAPVVSGALRSRRAMYGRETFLVRMADDSMSPALRAGDYAYVDPAEPAEPGRLVAIHDGSGGTTVREMVARSGRRVLRALVPGWPERVLDADNETMIRGVVVFEGRDV